MQSKCPRWIFLIIVGIALGIVVAGLIYQRYRPPPSNTPTDVARISPPPTSTMTLTLTPTNTPTGTPPPTPTPGPEFVENCDQSPSSRWSPAKSRGTLITTNDRCLFLPTSRKELNLALIGSPYWRNYAVEADVHYTRDDKDDYCGIIVLAQDERNYLYFSMGRRSQRVEWWMLRDGASTMVPESQRKSALKGDTVYHVRVEVLGGKIVTYLDGREVSRFSTGMFDAGLVGFLAYSASGATGHLCAFDNFQVLPFQP